MKRTQLYLDDELWTALHARARKAKTTISHLVRTAARDRYLYTEEQRSADMMAAVGVWKDRADLPDTETYVRSLRDGGAETSAPASVLGLNFVTEEPLSF